MPDKDFGFFFDFDGTLVDNVPVMRSAYHQFLKQLSVKSSDEEFDRYNGIPLKGFIDDLKEKESLQQSIDELLMEYFTVIKSFYKSIPPREGVRDFFNYLQSRQIPFCIVTSSTRQLLQEWLDKNLQVFSTIPKVTWDDVNQGKPHPEPYLMAKKLLGCKDGYAIEDSHNGIKSATDASLKPIFFQSQGAKDKVPNGFTGVVVSSFHDLREHFGTL